LRRGGWRQGLGADLDQLARTEQDRNLAAVIGQERLR
jgi:hypothetical protein